MAVKKTITRAISKTDMLLEKEGLYSDFEYEEIIDKGVYNISTGGYSDVETETHSFKGLVQSTGTSLQHGEEKVIYSGFNIIKEVMVFYKNISFIPNSKQIWKLGGEEWTVVDFTDNGFDTSYDVIIATR